MLFNKDKMDTVRVVLAVMAAVLSGGGALYGVYVKARSESRIDTAASYETLAPEINELKRAVQALESQNQTLRDNDRVREEREPEAPKPRRTISGNPQVPPSAPPGVPQEAPIPQEAPPPPPVVTAPAPAPESRDIVDDIKGQIPIDFGKAEELYRRVRKSREAP